MTAKKIAYLSSEYPAISHTFIFREVQAVRQEGIEVFTASINRPGHLEKMTDEEKADAENTLYIKSTPIPKALGIFFVMLLTHPLALWRMLRYTLWLFFTKCTPKMQLFAYWAEAILLLHWMRKHDVKHVHVHFANPASTVALIASKSGSAKFSISMHGPDDFYGMEKNLIREKVHDAVFVRCISYYCRSQMQLISEPTHWNKLSIIHCGIDTEKYTNLTKNKNNSKKFLSVARLSPAKGLFTLIQSMKILKEKGHDISLTIVGDGPYKDELQAAIDEAELGSYITLAGVAGQDIVYQYYQDADLFLLPSYAEGLPVVLMEAMSMGIPCVTSRITGIPEIIHDGENGLLATPSDAEDFAHCVEKLMTDETLRTKIAQNAPKVVANEYNIFKNCAKMAEIFTKL